MMLMPPGVGNKVSKCWGSNRCRDDRTYTFAGQSENRSVSTVCVKSEFLVTSTYHNNTRGLSCTSDTGNGEQLVEADEEIVVSSYQQVSK